MYSNGYNVHQAQFVARLCGTCGAWQSNALPTKQLPPSTPNEPFVGVISPIFYRLSCEALPSVDKHLNTNSSQNLICACIFKLIRLSPYGCNWFFEANRFKQLISQCISCVDLRMTLLR